MGHFDGSSITLDEKAITLLYETASYIHHGSAEFLDDRYIADLSTAASGKLAVLDSRAIDMDDLLEIETTYNSGGSVAVTVAALPEQAVALYASTHESTYQNHVDVTSVGARCAYFPASDLLAVDKGSNELICYGLANGGVKGVLSTTYSPYKLMNIGGELVVLERDDADTLYIERFSMTLPTSIAISGATRLGVGDKGDYTVSAGSYDLQPDASFVSSDPTVLSIDKIGRASAHKAGTVTITATTPAGLTATRKVTVSGGGVNKTLPDVTVLAGAKIDNWNENDYWTWSKPVYSYLAETAGGLMRVQARQSDVLVEYYNTAGRLTSTKTISFDLPRFGGFFASSDGSYYLVFGQDNLSQSDSTTVLRVIRYDSSWIRRRVYDLKGANTYVPLKAGTLRMAEADGKLYVHTCHEMYGDSVHHQANMTFVLQESDMSLVDSYFGVMNLSYGYVSHSFNQFVRVLDGVLYRVDHGDYSPRGIAFSATHTSDSVSDPYAYGPIVDFEASIDYNYTGASVGGCEVTDSHVVVAYSQDEEYGVNPRNVYVVAQDRSINNTAEITKITSYPEGSSITCCNPQLVRVNDRHLLLMWAEYDKDAVEQWAQFALLDHGGNVVAGPVRKSLPISDCQPIVLSDGSVAWYVSSDKAAALYTINPYDLNAMSDDDTIDSKEDPTLSAANVSLNVGKTATLSVNTNSDGALSYKSDNEEIATVDASGKVTGKKAGTTTVTIAVAATSVHRAATTTVQVTVTKMTPTLTVANTNVAIGKTKSLGASTSSDGVVSYESSDSGIVSVSSSGVVQGVTLGSTSVLVKVAATDRYEAVSKRVTVTVVKNACTWKRLWGQTALDTMQDIAANFGKTQYAVVTTNADFKDALSASCLAGRYQALVLTTAKGSLSKQTSAALKTAGVKTVYVIGSTGDVSDNVVKQLKKVSSGMTVTRISGASASAKAIAVAKKCGKLSDTVIIATQGTAKTPSFKDALSISPYSYVTKSPILYAETNKKLSSATTSYIKSAGFKKAIIVGGPVALPASIDSQLKSAGVASITRLAGGNSYDTSSLIAQWATGRLSNGSYGTYQGKALAYVQFQPKTRMSANALAVATSQSWKDALCGAALVGKNKSVLLLADDKGGTHFAQATGFCRDNATSMTRAFVLGGSSAVSARVWNELVGATA